MRQLLILGNQEHMVCLQNLEISHVGLEKEMRYTRLNRQASLSALLRVISLWVFPLSFQLKLRVKLLNNSEILVLWSCYTFLPNPLHPSQERHLGNKMKMLSGTLQMVEKMFLVLRILFECFGRLIALMNSILYPSFMYFLGFMAL